MTDSDSVASTYRLGERYCGDDGRSSGFSANDDFMDPDTELPVLFCSVDDKFGDFEKYRGKFLKSYSYKFVKNGEEEKRKRISSRKITQI